MKFGPLPTDQCVGAILAHSLDGIPKGTQLNSDHIEQFRTSGHTQLTVAVLEDGDVDENTAAARIAQSLTSSNMRVEKAHTGRVNLYATCRGLFCANSTPINTLNAVDEGLSIATLPDGSDVDEGTLVATIKIIPFAIATRTLDMALCNASDNALCVHPYTTKNVALIFTTTNNTTEKALQKSIKVTTNRLAHYGANITTTHMVAHEQSALTACLKGDASKADMILILGAAATVDRGDVIPQAIMDAGGCIHRHGMPVDPGNLLLLAALGPTTIIGLPGCAKSPARNGLDNVLDRLMAGLSVTGDDLGAMGVGGLLKETRRGLPRELPSPAPSEPKIAGVLMAAGTSSRMGADNKLLKEWQGTPLIVHAMSTLKGAKLDHILVVTGHDADQIAPLLPEGTATAHNTHFAEGMSTSVKTAIQNLPDEIDGALFMLADMPDVNASTLDELIAAIKDHPDALAIVPTWQGKRGNPVLWRREAFPLLTNLQGDQGARQIMMDHADRVIDLPVDDSGILLDVDTEAALKALSADNN